MFGSRKPSRILNDSKFILGLTIIDIGAAVLIFVFLARLLDDSPYAILSFLGAFVFCAALIPIRYKHREKTIRDFLMSIFCRGRISCD